MSVCEALCLLSHFQTAIYPHHECERQIVFATFFVSQVFLKVLAFCYAVICREMMKAKG